MSHGMNKVHAHEHEDRNRAEFVKTLRVLESGGFRRKYKRRHPSDAFLTIVHRIEQLFLADRHFAARLQAALASPHRPRAINLELKLNERVNRATRQRERANAQYLSVRHRRGVKELAVTNTYAAGARPLHASCISPHFAYPMSPQGRRSSATAPH